MQIENLLQEDSKVVLSSSHSTGVRDPLLLAIGEGAFPSTVSAVMKFVGGAYQLS